MHCPYSIVQEIGHPSCRFFLIIRYNKEHKIGEKTPFTIPAPLSSVFVVDNRDQFLTV
jgi:hypothetical protein